MPPSREPERSAWIQTPVVWVLAILFTVSAAWFLILYHRGVTKDSLDMEFAKALLNVGVVSVAATVLSLLVFGHERQVEREERERERRAEAQQKALEAEKARLAYRDELLKGTLLRITGSYNNTKRARRRMRALGREATDGADYIILERYDECMSEVNDAQLELELIKSDVKTSRSAYPSWDTLRASLKSMEQYLGELLEEYEHIRARNSAGKTKLALTAAPRLADFLGPSKGSSFTSAFSAQHAAAREALRGDLHSSVNPDAPSATG